jgi:hypothetical protein
MHHRIRLKNVKRLMRHYLLVALGVVRPCMISNAVAGKRIMDEAGMYDSVSGYFTGWLLKPRLRDQGNSENAWKCRLAKQALIH